MIDYSPAPKPPYRPSWLLAIAFVVIALLVGVVLTAVGVIAVSPTERVPGAGYKAPPAAVQVDDGCKEVAAELMSMLKTMNDEVVIPLSETGVQVIEAMYVNDLDAIDAATQRLGGVVDVQGTLTDRVVAVTPAYETCQR